LARYRTGSGKPLKKIGEARRILEGDFRAWNNRAAADIDAQDVAAAVRVISDRGSPYQARNALQYVGCLYGWAVGNLEFGIKASPVAGLKPNVLGLGKEERTRVLSDAELGKIWDAAEEMAYPYGDVIKLLILTGQRELEIASMRREELDGTTTILTIPASRMKGDRTHEVPLTAGAAEIIKSLPTFAGPYLFTTTAGEKPINGFSKAKARVDKISRVSNWVLRDIRRTVRTRFSALPVEDVVREAVIAHARKGLHKVYDQHEYQAEKRRCLMLWEERLAKVLKPSQVTDLDEARAQRSVA
jgi:integrase